MMNRVLILCAALLLPGVAAADGTAPVTVQVRLDAPLAPLPRELVGLSLEKELLTSGRLRATNRTLVRLLENLGPGTLRMGGNTVDRMVLEGSRAALPPGGVDGTYTLRQIADLFGLARATGWRVIYGLNLGAYAPALAAHEADAVVRLGRERLLALEIGNEPDLFVLQRLRPATWSVSAYLDQYAAYRRAIAARAPDAALSGPGVGNIVESPRWLKAFLERERPAGFASVHFYPMVAKTPLPAGSPFLPTLDHLLSPRILAGMTRRLFAPDLALARARGTPFRVSECNTVARGGEAGVSDVFASALWIAEWALRLAELGAQGVNVQCDLVNAHDLYTPLLEVDGRLTARPMYHGLLLLGRLESGTLVQARVLGSRAVTAHAVAGRTVQIVLLNLDARQAARVRIPRPAPAYLDARVMRLLAPSLSARAGIMLGGSAVAADGSWAPRRIERALRSGDAWELDLPAGSGALVELSGSR